MSSPIGPNELRALLGVVPDVVILVSTDRRIRYVNRGAEGYGVDAVLGRDFLELVGPSHRMAQAEMFRKVLTSGEPASDETEVINAAGEPEWHEGSMFPLCSSGTVVDVAIVTRNVTARRLAEEEAKALRRLVPVCSWCRMVRNHEGHWQTIETYIAERGDSLVTHGMCPVCEGETRVGSPRSVG